MASQLDPLFLAGTMAGPAVSIADAGLSGVMFIRLPPTPVELRLTHTSTSSTSRVPNANGLGEPWDVKRPYFRGHHLVRRPNQ